MKVKIFGRNITNGYTVETSNDYEQRLNAFIEKVKVIDIKTETYGYIEDGNGNYYSNLIIMYEEK